MLVLTNRAMREPLDWERATGPAPRFFCICYNTLLYYADVELSANKKCYNMKQTIHKFLLLAVLAIVGVMNASAYTCCIDGIYYNVDKTKKTAGVTYKSGNIGPYDEGAYSGSVVIPESIIYEGVKYPVTRIAAWAFKQCRSLTSITIPGSVTSIGKGAFYDCSSLTSPITIPENMKSIEDSTFYNCVNSDITIPNSVASVGDYAFYKCSSITTPATISNAVRIGKGAFSQSSGLKSITFSNSITEIPDEAFRSCKSLTSITIPNSVTSFGDYAFYCCI